LCVLTISNNRETHRNWHAPSAKNESIRLRTTQRHRAPICLSERLRRPSCRNHQKASRLAGNTPHQFYRTVPVASTGEAVPPRYQSPSDSESDCSSAISASKVSPHAGQARNPTCPTGMRDHARPPTTRISLPVKAADRPGMRLGTAAEIHAIAATIGNHSPQATLHGIRACVITTPLYS
jgi:hypothetical protein